MKKLLTFVLGCAVVLLGLVGLGNAATGTFDRNNDAITSEYNVWACFTLNCVVVKSSSTLQEQIVIPQTASGVNPSFTIDLTGLSGSIAVSAKRASGEESGLSVPANFTATAPPAAAPATPVNLSLQ